MKSFVCKPICGPSIAIDSGELLLVHELNQVCLFFLGDLACWPCEDLSFFHLRWDWWLSDGRSRFLLNFRWWLSFHSILRWSYRDRCLLRLFALLLNGIFEIMNLLFIGCYLFFLFQELICSLIFDFINFLFVLLLKCFLLSTKL